jgi:hypothetical protein
MLQVLIVSALALAQTPLEARLRHELADLRGIQFTQDEETLTVRYRTENVKQRAESMSRAPVLKMVMTEIPSPTGFKLETYDFAHKPTDPPRAMQSVNVGPDGHDRGTWRWDAKDIQIKGADQARYYHLEWGSKIDPHLLAKIRRTLELDTTPIPSR